MSENTHSVTLYLAGWQRRMIADFLGDSPAKAKSLQRLTRIKVAILDKRQFVMYKQPDPQMAASSWNLYLTDEQICILEDKVGIKEGLSAIRISDEMIKSGAVALH